MKRRWQWCLATAVAGLVSLLPAAAQPPAEGSPPKVNPVAMKALADMGAYLRSLEAFHVSAATTDEDVLEDGQKVHYDGQTEVLVKKPDRLRGSVTNERHERLYLYDGSNLTIYGKRLNYYATVPAPPTLRELVAKLDNEYGIIMPLADLFAWGTPDYDPQDITSALDAGPSPVNGVTCGHYVFRQPGMDWQIWIQKGAYPLPRKLVITTVTDDARPQYTAVYTWNLAPSFNEAAFVFEPPAGAGRVLLAREE